MKKMWHPAIQRDLRFMFLYVLILTTGVSYRSAGLAASIRPTDQVTIASGMIYNDGNLGQPDSVNILTLKDGSVVFTGWYNTGDAECSADSGFLVFTDQLQDIDGAGGNGHYVIMGRAYDKDSTLYTPWIYSFDVGMWDAVDGINTKTTETLDTLQNQDNWVATATALTNAIDSIQAILDSIQAVVGVNTIQISGDATAADNAELFFDDTGFNASNSKIGTATAFGNNALTAAALAPGAVAEINEYILVSEKAVVEDSGGNSAQYFQTSLTATDNDIYNRSMMRFISGNKDGFVTSISDYVGASGVVYVKPGLVGGAPNAGDSFVVLTIMSGLIPNDPDSNEVNVYSGYVGIDIDNKQGTWGSADFEDSAFAAIKFKTDYYDTLTQIVSDNAGTVTLPDSVAGMVPTLDSVFSSVGAYSDTSITAKLGAYDGTTGHGNLEDELDSLGLHIGKAGQSTERVSLHMKIGDYSGGAGDNNNIKDDIAAVSTQGGGTEPETLFVFDSDTTAVEGVSVTVRNLDQTSTKVPGHRTDSSGRVFLELDPDSFVVALYANNYIQPDLDTIAVATGGGTDTLWMNRFDPGNPPSPDLCRVYGWVYDITGDSLEGVTVISEIPPEFHPVKYSNVIITPFKKFTKTDSTGYWQIDLFPNSVLSDTISKYLFIIEYPSGIVFKTRVEVPDSTSWQLK